MTGIGLLLILAGMLLLFTCNRALLFPALFILLLGTTLAQLNI